MATVLDLIWEEQRALRREVTRMAETQADILGKLTKLETTMGNLEAVQDLTAIGARLDAVTARAEALVTAAQPPAASEPTPQIDPNTGQPVQPV